MIRGSSDHLFSQFDLLLEVLHRVLQLVHILDVASLKVMRMMTMKMTMMMMMMMMMMMTMMMVTMKMRMMMVMIMMAEWMYSG